jgi:Sulfotransferase family
MQPALARAVETTVYCLAMPEVQRVLPEARFIHLLRDGRDVAVSVRPLWFSPGKDVATIARDWRYRIETTRQLASQCEHYLEVRYEDLVRKPRRELRRICEFIELPYHRAMRKYHRHAGARLDEHEARALPNGGLLTKDQRRQQQRTARQPVQRDRIGRWATELTVAEQAEFVGVAGDLLVELGYSSP